MRLAPANVDDLHQALVGLPGNMNVEASPDTGITDKTVDELRARTTWPPGLSVEIPREHYPESTVKISKSG